MKTKNYISAKIGLVAVSSLFIGNIACAQVKTEGPNHGVSTVVLANKGETWKNAANIFFPDNQYASVSLGAGEVSDTMEIGNFHFNIPADAIIQGITVTVKRGATAGGITDNTVKLVCNGIVGGTEHAKAEEWASSPEVCTYGGNDDLWGMAWTPTGINSYSFGVAISAANSLFSIDSSKAEIDYVNVSVSYKKPESLAITSFIAEYNDGAVNLKWTVAQQKSDDKFMIERKAGEGDAVTISTIDATSTTDQPVCYTYTDKSPVMGDSYYRISQADADGNTRPYNWVHISASDDVSGVFIAPNPGENKITVKFPSQGNPAMLMIMDGNGKVVVSQSVNTEPNANSTVYTQDISGLPQGIYFMLVNNGTKNYTDKFVKR